MDDEDEIGRAIPGERAELSAEAEAGAAAAESATPDETAREVLEGISQGVEIASQVVAGLDSGLEGRDRPANPPAAVSGALGGLGSALGGVASAVAGADAGVSAALGLAGALSTTVGSAVEGLGSIIESITSMAERANRHSVVYSFTSAADPDAELMVVSFTMTERLGAPYVLRLTVAIEDLDFRPRALLGRDCTLELNRGEAQRKVHGLVRSVERGRTTDRARVITLEIVPALAALELRRDSRTFQGLTVPEILETVLGALDGYGRETQDATHRSYPIREHCVQYQETDLAFVHRLMEEEGITYFFDHSGEHEKMILVDDADGHVPLLDDGEHVPFVEQRGETSETEHVHALVRTDQLRATSFALRDLDWTRYADRAVVSAEDVGEDEQGWTRELYEHDRAVTLDQWDGRAFGRDDADEQLRIRGEEHLTTMDVFEGTGNVTEFAPGRTFCLENHPVRELDAELLLVSVEHRGHSAQLTDLLGNHAFGDDEVSYECSFACIPKDVPYRSRRVTPKPRIHGLLSAVVVGAEGQEIHSDLHRRVRVQMRWDRLGTLDERSSCFVRVLQPWAGAGFGALFLPRVGMEVAIAFLDGDPDRPIVSGCFYNADNPPPYTESADWTKSTLKSRSSPASGDGADHYNELRFEDAAGSEQIFIHAEKDLDEEILHDHTRHVGRNQTNRVDANHTETVGGDQCLTVRGDRHAAIEGVEEITVTNSRRVQTGTDHTLIVDGERAVHVQRLDREAYAGSRDVWVRGTDQLTVQGNIQRFVHGRESVITDEGHDLTHTDSMLAVRDGINGISDHAISLTVGDSRLTISPDGHVTLLAGAQLTLSAGGASIVLSSDGIAMGGVNISLTGSSSVAVSGSTVEVSGRTSVTASAGSSTLELALSGANLQGPIIRIN